MTAMVFTIGSEQVGGLMAEQSFMAQLDLEPGTLGSCPINYPSLS